MIDFFRNGSGFDALMTGLARKAYLVEGVAVPPHQVSDPAPEVGQASKG